MPKFYLRIPIHQTLLVGNKINFLKHPLSLTLYNILIYLKTTKITYFSVFNKNNQIEISFPS